MREGNLEIIDYRNYRLNQSFSKMSLFIYFFMFKWACSNQEINVCQIITVVKEVYQYIWPWMFRELLLSCKYS